MELIETSFDDAGSFQRLNRFVDLLRTQQTVEDLDCLIGVSGLKGLGKSTFSTQVSKRYYERYIEPGGRFGVNELERYTAYTIDDVFEKIDTLPDYSVLSGDEAVNFALGEDWMRRNRKNLKKIFTRIRTKHFIFFFNIPDIWWLDKKYRENMMSFWVHIIKKGITMLSLPNVAPGIEDRWYRKWLQKTFDKKIMTYFTPAEDQMKILRKYPCYFDEIPVPKLDEVLYQKHLYLREQKMMHKETEDDDDLFKLEWKAIPVFNIRERFPLLVKWIENVKSNGGVPSYEQITNFFYYNPVTRESFLEPRTLNRIEMKFKRYLEAIEIQGI